MDGLEEFEINFIDDLGFAMASSSFTFTGKGIPMMMPPGSLPNEMSENLYPMVE